MASPKTIPSKLLGGNKQLTNTNGIYITAVYSKQAGSAGFKKGNPPAAASMSGFTFAGKDFLVFDSPIYCTETTTSQHCWLMYYTQGGTTTIT